MNEGRSLQGRKGGGTAIEHMAIEHRSIGQTALGDRRELNDGRPLQARKGGGTGGWLKGCVLQGAHTR